MALKVLDMDLGEADLGVECPFYRFTPYQSTTVFWRVENQVSETCGNVGWKGIIPIFIPYNRRCGDLSDSVAAYGRESMEPSCAASMFFG